MSDSLNTLEIAEDIYLSLLLIPVNSELRVRAQPALCLFRDYIADRTGRSAEDVQVDFEQAAMQERGR